MRYKVLLIPHGNGGYTAVVPSLPGCVTEGESFDAALMAAREAATGWLETAVAHGRDIPTEPDGTVVAELETMVPALAAIP